MPHVPDSSPILTSEQMREADRRAIEQIGIPGPVLMENASRGALEALARHLNGLDGRRIVVLCGRGNNGGDGIALARLAVVAGADVRCILLFPSDRLSADAALQHRVLSSLAPEAISTWEDFREAPDRPIDAIVDALLGTGSHGQPTAPLDEAISWSNGIDTFRFAIDLPTGLDGDTGQAAAVVFHADATATMAALKPGVLLRDGPAVAGRIEVVHIGLPIGFYHGSGIDLLDATLCRRLLPPISPTRHKYDRGKVLVIGGSPGMLGAPIMSAESALAAGAGLVVLALPAGSTDAIHSLRPEIMTRYLSASGDGAFDRNGIDELREELNGFAAIAIGPGLSRSVSARDLVRALVGETTRPIVVDADGLNAFAGSTDLLKQSRADIVITPHHGEMARLLGIQRNDVTDQPVEKARSTAQDLGLTVVLKGAPTVVAFSDGRCWINGAGNPGMATAGSGDVLTGAIAALIAQTGSSQQGALAAVYLHSLAGDIASSAGSIRSLRATDITASFAGAYRRLEEIQ